MLDFTGMQRRFLLVVISLRLTMISLTEASSILGFGLIGGRSYQLTILRIGREMSDRGHNFTLLTSVHEKLSPSMLDRAGAKDVHMVTFDGPADLGTEEWLNQLHRDRSQVLRPFIVMLLTTCNKTQP